MPNTVTRRKPRSAKGRLAQHRRLERRAAWHREQLITQAIPLEDLPEVDPAETMQLLMNRVERLYRHAAAQADLLIPGVAKNSSPENLNKELWVAWDDNQNLVVTSNYWIHRERELGEQLAKLVESAQKLGLADRRARVLEQQIQLMGEALQAAAEAAGIGETQRRQLGQELRTRLVAIERGGSGEDIVDAEVVAA